GATMDVCDGPVVAVVPAAVPSRGKARGPRALYGASPTRGPHRACTTGRAPPPRPARRTTIASDSHRSVSSDDSEVVEALVTGGARPSAYRELLRNRGYRVWFLSSLASCLGDWTGLFALQVLVASLAEPGSRTA